MIVEGYPSPFKCYECGQAFNDVRDYGSHLKNEHEVYPPKYVCGLCDHMTKPVSVNPFLNHLIDHHDLQELGLACIVEGCNVVKSGPADIKIHIERNHSDFKGNIDLLKEMWDNKYDKTNGKNFPSKMNCIECSLEFNHTHSLQSHMVSVHGYAPSFPCNLCGKSFNNQGDCKKHEHGCISKRNKEVFQCSMCEYTTQTKRALQDHERAHDRTKNHRCSVEGCEAIFYFQSELRAHHIIHHTTDKPFVCSELITLKDNLLATEKNDQTTVCNKSFRSRGDLHVHKKTHRHESKYCCTICDRETFKTQGQLYKHILCSHVKPLKCPYLDCSYGTSDKRQLADHVFIHSSLKTFVCQFCSKQFRQKQTYESHVNRNHTKTKEYPCTSPGCDKIFYGFVDCQRHVEKCHSGKLRLYNSDGEQELAAMFDRMEIGYEPQFYVNTTTTRLFIDFHVMFNEGPVWVEYDGCYHFREHHCHDPEKRCYELIRNIYRDFIKSRTAKERGIELLRVTNKHPSQDALFHFIRRGWTWTKKDGSVYDALRFAEEKETCTGWKDTYFASYIDRCILNDRNNIVCRLANLFGSTTELECRHEDDVFRIALSLTNAPVEILSESRFETEASTLYDCWEGIVLLFLREMNKLSCDEFVDAYGESVAVSLLRLCSRIPEIYEYQIMAEVRSKVTDDAINRVDKTIMEKRRRSEDMMTVDDKDEDMMTVDDKDGSNSPLKQKTHSIYLHCGRGNKCEARFNMAKDLHDHLTRKHHDEFDFPVACHQCGVGLQFEQRSAHIKNCPMGKQNHTKSIRCIKDTCTENFAKEHNYFRHLKDKHGVDFGPFATFQCGNCQRKEDSKTKIFRHMREKNCKYKEPSVKIKVEPIDGEWTCQVCDIKCCNIDSLRRHIKNSHLNNEKQ